MPSSGREEILHDIDDRPRLRILLALLRAADCLDCGGAHPPHLVLALSGSTISIVRYLSGHQVSLHRARPKPRKLRLLQDVLHCRVEVDVHVVESCTLVA